MKSFFQAVWSQKEIYDNMVEEKSHSDLLVDLITHDIGNHHGVVQGGLDLMSELISEKLDQLDYVSNSGNIQNYDTSGSGENKYEVHKSYGNNSRVLSSSDSQSFDLNGHEQKIKTSLSKEFFEDLLSYVSMVQGALDKSQTLVKNIIKLEKMYRQKEVHLYKKNIVDSIEDAKEVFNNNDGNRPKKSDDRKIKLEVFIDKNFKKEDVNIMADDLLKEIFINIFSNSIKYTNKYPVIPIHISITEYDISDTKYWMILVSDYGKGIPDSIKDGLFERFYSKASGSGLGLSIVRSLIERYNGRVWASDRVASSHKEGVTIGMIFPKFID
jgi:signal transduction histidine kinase